MTKFTMLQPLSIGTMLLLTTTTTGASYAQQQQLNLNQDKWDFFIGSPNAGYEMEFQRVCFCMPEYLGPFQVVVNSTGDVVSATYLEGSEYPGVPVSDLEDMNLITVQDAFDEIQRALDEGAADLDVTYDAGAGYPGEVSIDWDEMIADEEIYFTMNNVVPL